MTDFVIVTLIVTVFRTTMIFIGLTFAYLGYRLFKAGVYEHAGDLKAAWGERNLVLKQAAPGTFFALFGVAVIAISIFRGTGLEVSSVPITSPANVPISAVALKDYPTVAELIKDSNIPVDRLPHMGLAMIYNTYFRARTMGMPKLELEAIFRDIVAPAVNKDIAETNPKPAKLADVRAELFKEVSQSARPVLGSSAAKFGLGL